MQVMDHTQQVKNWIKFIGAKTHSAGVIVHSPPGSGKSWVVQHDGGEDWVDVDEFVGKYLKFHTEAWHSAQKSEAEIKKHYLECDKYLQAMRKEGLWVVGSLFENYIPDAILLLDIKQHRKWVEKREDLDWDTANDVRNLLEDMSRKNGVKIYRDWGTLHSSYAILAHLFVAAHPERNQTKR